MDFSLGVDEYDAVFYLIPKWKNQSWIYKKNQIIKILEENMSKLHYEVGKQKSFKLWKQLTSRSLKSDTFIIYK